LGALFQGKSRYSGSDGRQGDALDGFLLGAPQAVAQGEAQRLGGGPASQAHARGVNHIMSLEAAARGDCGFAEGDGSDPLAFFLDPTAAFAPDGSGHARAQDEVGVGRVHDRVYSHVCDIALYEMDFRRHE
jgi:hypothetical protein